MNGSVPDCLVTGYEKLVLALELPDPDDRHVLAAAIRAGAQVIVTANLRDFPDAELAQFGVEAKHPDEFVMELFNLDGVRVHEAVSATASAWRNPPVRRLVCVTDSRPLDFRSRQQRFAAEGGEAQTAKR